MRRRTFVKSTAVFVAATPVLNAMQPIQRLGPPRLKLGLSAYSLRQYLTAPDGTEGKIDLIGFLDYCAKLTLGGAELTSYYFPTEVTLQYLNAVKRHAHMAGLTITGGAIKNDFCLPAGEALDREMAQTEQWINYYAELGAPAIRIFAGRAPQGEPEDAVIARCVENINKACELAGKRGVMLALENHGGITAKAERMMKIIQQVNSPWFGVNFDSGNFDSADPYAELAMIAPYAINAQIKTDMSVGGQKQPADLPRVIKILKDAGYSGWVILEYEGEEPPYDAIPRYVEQLRALVDS